MKKIVLSILVLGVFGFLGYVGTTKLISSKSLAQVTKKFLTEIPKNSYSTSCSCACPYVERIVILGKGSTTNSPEAVWFSENVRSDIIYPLEDGNLQERIDQIKKRIKNSQGNSCPKKKILIIGYSLGGSVAKNFKKEFPCVDIVTVDPPSSAWCNLFIPQFFNKELAQICKSNNLKSNQNINWTNGDSGNTSEHYPWGNPAANLEKLQALISSLNSFQCK
jgi:hypothetical protein